MPGLSSEGLTGLLRAWSEGNAEAAERLLPLVYGELRRQAARYLRREPNARTLQPTALVHEAYIRLANQDRARWKDRHHFFAIAAQVMRRALVDHARRRHAARRGGSRPRVTLAEADAVAAPRDVDLLDLDQALGELARLDPRRAAMVELRYFGGLSIEETARTLGVSPRTVLREWKLARAWLHRRLS